LNLLLERHASQESIHRFAADDAIVVIVATTLCARDKVLDARIRFRKRILAEEAQVSLREHQPVKRSGRHGLLTFAFCRAARSA
jgi:hypothetical protein